MSKFTNIISKNAVTEHQEVIELILSAYKELIGAHFPLYRNHVYRVYNLAALQVNDEKQHELLAIGSAFHDIGIWTSNTFDYLEPSKQLAKQFMQRGNYSLDGSR